MLGNVKCQPHKRISISQDSIKMNSIQLIHLSNIYRSKQGVGLRFKYVYYSDNANSYIKIHIMYIKHKGPALWTCVITNKTIQ